MEKQKIPNEDNLVKTGNLQPDLIAEVNDNIVVIREIPVLIDRDVAAIYGVATRDINKAVKNNPRKFPTGYYFELDAEEKRELVENFHRFDSLKHSTVMPKAFSEKGLYMLATILKSDIATEATLAIIETFAKVRSLKRELKELHKETDKELQNRKMQHFGEVLTDIVMPDLETSETESTLELNFLIGKIKHTVKRVKKNNNQ